MLLWFSLLTSPGLVTIGALGPLLGLSLADSVITTVVGTCFGSIFPALMATISPVTGLRQIAVSRYAFGIQGAKLCSFLNIVVNIGYGIIGSIVAGQILGSVSGGSLDLSVGIVIVIVVALVVSFLGYHILQHYESVAWIFVAILLVVNFGQAAKYFPSDITHHELQGKTYTGVGLTYFAIVFGQCVAWSSVAGDYYVHYPVNVNKVKLAIFTWLGMTLPTLFVSILGCYLGAAILTNAEVGNAYETGGFGAAILTTMHPAGYAKFVGVIYTFSFSKPIVPSLPLCVSILIANERVIVVGNITAILYSSSLALQLFGKRFLAVPRFIWVILMSIATLALSLGGRNVFEAILENLLPLLGYWTICFAIVLLFEHFIFRPRVGGYDLDGWQDSKRTPLGLAGVGTLLSAIALSFLGMNQTWVSWFLLPFVILKTCPSKKRNRTLLC